jgi:repressor LexA
MVEAGIQEGDVVVVRVQTRVENGEIGVVSVEGEVTVKRVQDCGSTLRLVSENSKYVPVEVQKKEGVRVVGKVVGLVRRL